MPLPPGRLPAPIIGLPPRPILGWPPPGCGACTAGRAGAAGREGAGLLLLLLLPASATGAAKTSKPAQATLLQSGNRFMIVLTRRDTRQISPFRRIGKRATR